MEEYFKICHAIQTGVRAIIDIENPNVDDAVKDMAKHLRVGVDTGKIEHGALLKLLVDKKIINIEEYENYVIEFLQRDVKTREQQLSQLYGRRTTLE